MLFKHLHFLTATPLRLARYITTKASLTRTITTADVAAFTALSGDTNPVHTAAPGAQRALVHGALLNGLVSALLGTRVPGPGAVVVAQTLRFPAKCYVGDTVTVQAELREDRKIMRVEYRCVVGGDRVVLEGEARLVWDKKK